MSGFTFKFESVLRHRRTMEDQRQRELAQQLRLRMGVQQQLRAMDEQIRESRRAMSQALVGKVDMDQVGAFARYSGQSTGRAHELVQKLAQLEQRILHSRQRLLEATQARKAMEMLRAKHERAWRAQQQKRQRVAMDELATQRYVRGMAEGGGP